MKRLYEIFFKLPQPLKLFFTRKWYESVSAWDKDADMIFMNLGWSDLNNDGKHLGLDESDEHNRYQIQLYNHVVSGIDLKGLNVLEIGCGRGGGASFVKRYHNPRNLFAMDITANAISFCRGYYSLENLYFLRGDAESPGITDNKFDVVLNIESSHTYTDMQKFFNNVYRILKPGGYFLFADACFKKNVTELQRLLCSSLFKIIKEENISANVLRALELDSDRKKSLIKKKAPKLFRGLISEFAGTADSKNSPYTFLRSGRVEYLNFILQK